jgi:regulator of cell morphogenesis and NO signaling
MSELNLDTPVGQWVAESPCTSRVFESFHIDYCCGGDKPLAVACAARNADPHRVFAELKTAMANPRSEDRAERWIGASLTELCDHIEQTHHAYLKTELPRLHAMIAKVLGVHGASHPEMSDVQQAFTALETELNPHMFKEEQVLFPAIRRLETSDVLPKFPFGTVANPIRMMEHEHDNAGDALDRIRRATTDYAAPDDACNTYRAMLDGLRQLELDMHRHVHKENYILFPRAIELEQTLPDVQ